MNSSQFKYIAAKKCHISCLLEPQKKTRSTTAPPSELTKCLKYICEDCQGKSIVDVLSSIEVLNKKVAALELSLSTKESAYSIDVAAVNTLTKTAGESVEVIKTLINKMQTVLNTHQPDGGSLQLNDSLRSVFDTVESTLTSDPPRSTDNAQDENKVPEVANKNDAGKVKEKKKNTKKKKTPTPPITAASELTSAHHQSPTTQTQTSVRSPSISAAVARRWIFVGNLSNKTTTNSVIKFLSRKIGCNDIIGKFLHKNGTDYRTLDAVKMKIGVPVKFFNAALNPMIWPPGLLIKEFFDGPRLQPLNQVFRNQTTKHQMPISPSFHSSHQNQWMSRQAYRRY